MNLMEDLVKTVATSSGVIMVLMTTNVVESSHSSVKHKLLVFELNYR